MQTTKEGCTGKVSWLLPICSILVYIYIHTYIIRCCIYLLFLLLYLHFTTSVCNFRMCTILKKQGPSLGYLEEVRKHLSRLPSINPNTRTLVMCGFPNVGKSSFMNKVTRADVDVQPFAFTTKVLHCFFICLIIVFNSFTFSQFIYYLKQSLFVGHMDYKYLRWQVIDTPGILGKVLLSFLPWILSC